MKSPENFLPYKNQDKNNQSQINTEWTLVLKLVTPLLQEKILKCNKRNIP